MRSPRDASHGICAPHGITRHTRPTPHHTAYAHRTSCTAPTRLRHTPRHAQTHVTRSCLHVRPHVAPHAAEPSIPRPWPRIVHQTARDVDEMRAIGGTPPRKAGIQPAHATNHSVAHAFTHLHAHPHAFSRGCNRHVRSRHAHPSAHAHAPRASTRTPRTRVASGTAESTESTETRHQRNSETPRRAMQNALPSHVCLEFGHTAPSRGAFWLIQMLGTRPSALRDPSRLKPFFSLSQ